MKNSSQPCDPSAKPEGISRREMVQKLVSGASTGIIASSIAVPASAEVRPPAPATGAVQSAQPAEWTPLFLDARQVDTLNVLAEIIIPESTKAQVTQFIDLLLSVDTIENRAKFVAAISATDGEAMRRENIPFKQLAPAWQIEILTLASKTSASGGRGSIRSGSMARSALPTPCRKIVTSKTSTTARATWWISTILAKSVVADYERGLSSAILPHPWQSPPEQSALVFKISLE